MTVPVDLIESAATATWSPDETAVIGGWRVSSNGGFTRRLNSATAIGQAETSFEVKRSVRSWLAERGGSLVVRVTPLTDPDTATSCERNWYLARRDETRVLIRRISDIAFPASVQVTDADDAAFMDEFFSLNGRRPSDDGVWTRMVERSGSDAAGLWIPGTAVGFVAMYGPLAFTYSVAVDASLRRSGAGTAIMEAATGWAATRGAVHMILQVLGTNDAALRLYDTLGFSEAYRYHYLQVPEGPSQGQAAEAP